MAVSFLATAEAAAADGVTLWHAYRGQEKEAIEALAADWNARHAETPLVLLAVPYEAFANKLAAAIPRGHGPDLFIAAHERVGDWAQGRLVAALSEGDFPAALRDAYFPVTLDALTYRGNLYGFPLAFKSTALFVNTALLHGASPPRTTGELLAFCRAFKASDPDKFCLAYEAGSFYHHAAWLHGFGGGVFAADGTVALDTPANAASLAFARDLTRAGYVPQEPSATLVTQLFNDGKTAFAINGPWFAGEISPTVQYGVRPLPIVSETDLAAKPFLTVEAVLLSAYSTRRETALQVAEFLAGPEGAAVRLTKGRQAVALKSAYEAAGSVDPVLLSFKSQAETAIPMPNDPLMRAVWEPAAQALRKALRGAVEPDVALSQAQIWLKVISRPAPQAANPFLYLVLCGVVVMGGGGFLLYRLSRRGVLLDLRKSAVAYAYLAPAAIGMVILVFVPFAVGTAVSLFSHRAGEFTFVGFANYWNILASADYAIDEPLSFYFTLAVTVLWTASNVFLHVAIGLALALLLRDPWMRLRGVYRVLLIVPWAVPNYITALIWKGMFHKQFGAINGLLVWLGLEPVSWFSHFWTAFAANLSTNAWLGFPFMMVVTLGALQSIPRDLEEAAEVDGAGRFQRFFTITLPLLKPALLPAVILGSVWTFNMFNIIYLVSGGEPDGATEILITEAYRWAFTRQEQYGYAAAYATLIFLVLLVYSWGTRKLVREA